MKLYTTLLLMVLANSGVSQESTYTRNLDWDHERHAWSSFWITHPTESVVDYGVFLFRNEFEMESVPETFKVYVSADNRYRLFVNGAEVSFGPARGSLEYWHYETLDLAPFLQKGKNIIAAEVFNLGPLRPVAQFSYVTAFIFQSEQLAEWLNTGVGPWKVIRHGAYHPRIVTPDMVAGKFYVAGPCDSIVGSAIIEGWKNNDFVMENWLSPKKVQKGSGRGYMHGSPWMLIPRTIPPMEQKVLRFAGVARQQSTDGADAMLKGNHPMVIPSNSSVQVLIDNKELSMGFPELKVSGGKDAHIKVTYSEVLYDANRQKGNRNEIEDKSIIGYSDVFIPDGRQNMLYRPLWIRTFRFVQLDIRTGSEPLTIEDFYFRFTAYPFEAKGQFASDNAGLKDIWGVGWRTARLCALETYMDCPYWEQLQYIGDTRIQSLISLNVAGDDRLMREALLTADRSRTAEGLTMGRGPTFVPQITPPFSLYWVDMVHDYFMHRDDPEFVRQFLPGIEAVLGWFERRLDKNGMLGPLDWFNFSDWTKGFLCGAPAGVDDGNSALISLNYVYALERAAALFSYFGEEQKALKYHEQAESIKKSVYALCYDSEKGLLADTPLKQEYSQHTNIFGLLTHTFDENSKPEVMRRILTDTSLIQTTIYYKFYLFEALKSAGMAEEYLDHLGPWYDMLNEGLTTFEEGDFDDRSDCHAWGSSPLYHFMSIVGGISPASQGFKTVRIEPALGSLNELNIAMPHPMGVISLRLAKSGKNKLTGVVMLPESLSGEFIYNQQTVKLSGGMNTIKID